MSSFIDHIKGKKVLFITTKNIDYIRNTQELRILKQYAENVETVYSEAGNYAARILGIFKKLTKKRINDADIIFAGFAPQIIVPILKFRKNNKPVIIDFFISVYDTLVCDRKKIKDGSPVAKYCHRMDEKTICYADHIITDTKAHADWFISEFNGDREKFETLYLQADPDIYYPREQKMTEETNKKFTVLYFGSVLPLQGVEIILAAIDRIGERNDIFFDIIGPIPNQMKRPEQSNIRYTEWLSQEELAERIAQADLCLAGHFCDTIQKASRTIPGKAYIYESMKKRMILGDNPANRELFSDDNMHYFVKMGDSDDLVKKILFIEDAVLSDKCAYLQV